MNAVCRLEQVLPKSFGNSASLSHNHATILHWLQWHIPNLPPKLSLPFGDHHLHLIQTFVYRPHSPPQVASETNQPFCHSTLSGWADRQTDRWVLRQVGKKSALYALLIVSDALKTVLDQRSRSDRPHYHAHTRCTRRCPRDNKNASLLLWPTVLNPDRNTTNP